MLVIRMQRTGRKGHAQFRVVVQDSRRTPTSGKVVARLGHFNPHTKQTVIDKEKAQFYLDHGAQPSPRVVRLLKAEKVKLPAWVKGVSKKEKATKNPDKLRRNRPAEPEAVAEAAETPAAVEENQPAEAAGEKVEDAQREATAPEDTPAESAGENQAEPAPQAAEAPAEAASAETAEKVE